MQYNHGKLWQGANHAHLTHPYRLCYYLSLALHNSRHPLVSLAGNYHTQYMKNSFLHWHILHLWPWLLHPERQIVKPQCTGIPLALSNTDFSNATLKKGTPAESGINHLEHSTFTFSHQVLCLKGRKKKIIYTCHLQETSLPSCKTPCWQEGFVYFHW